MKHNLGWCSEKSALLKRRRINPPCVATTPWVRISGIEIHTWTSQIVNGAMNQQWVSESRIKKNPNYFRFNAARLLIFPDHLLPLARCKICIRPSWDLSSVEWSPAHSSVLLSRGPAAINQSIHLLIVFFDLMAQLIEYNLYVSII